MSLVSHTIIAVIISKALLIVTRPTVITSGWLNTNTIILLLLLLLLLSIYLSPLLPFLTPPCTFPSISNNTHLLFLCISLPPLCACCCWESQNYAHTYTSSPMTPCLKKQRRSNKTETQGNNQPTKYTPISSSTFSKSSPNSFSKFSTNSFFKSSNQLHHLVNFLFPNPQH